MSPTERTSNRTSLSHGAVIEAAVDLADRIGVEALTIRKLADHLGTKPMTLYHHVANKEAIIDGMVDRVFNEIERPPADRPWREALAVRSRSAREVLRRHWWAAPLMESRHQPGPGTLEHHEAVLACLRDAGFSLPLTAHAYAILDSYIYGFALQEASLPGGGGEELAELAPEILGSVPSGLYPRLMEFTADHVMRPGYSFGRSFEFGLDLLLNGLEAARRAETDTG